MGVVSAAIIGGSVLSGVASVVGSKMAADSQNAAADRAREAALESTRMQVEEAQRQYDRQQEQLRPFLDRQNRAGESMSDMLGYGASRNADGSFRDRNLSNERMGADSARESELGQHAYNNTLTGERPEDDAAVQRANAERLYRGMDQDTAVQNADRNRLAGATLETDIGYRSVDDRRLAAATMAQDERFAFARDTAVVGDTFETSPGYQFAMEEAAKEVDRRNSRGGANYGGRALMEAQRRAQGEANREYYNWVGARHADLARMDAAAGAYQGLQGADAARLDNATLDYLRRQGVDIGRMDAAVGDARRREEVDMMRGDAALEGYFGRRGYDLGRQDAAIRDNNRLREGDRARGDQAYYNWLQMQAAMSGAGGNYVGQAAGAAAQYGAQAGAAYANQGNMLAGIYQNQGQANAQAWASGAANVNNSAQQGIGNYLLWNHLGG